MTRETARETLRLYLPLVGFVVPTLVIGYGVVIPRSCIAGVNELSIGFGTTVLGAAMTYVAGLRLAGPSCSRLTRRQRIERYINRQAARPHGFFGRILGLIWRFEHREVNHKTIELLDVAQRHEVLEIGCGSGLALRKVAARASAGHAVGLDVSEVMVSAARRRNAELVRRGRVDVRQTDGEDLRLGEAAFDRAFSVHSLYFWKNPRSMLGQIARALRPGGRLVLAFRTNEAVPARFRDEVYRFYSTDEVADMLAQAGFERVRVENSKAVNALAWVSAER
jgi:SAM-dependent methyltransferase